MIRAFIFAGVVYGVVWATDIYDKFVNRNREEHDDDNR